VQRNTVWKEIPMSLLAALVLGICANDAIINSSGTQSAITRTDGLILLAFFIIFMYYVTDSARNNPESADEEFKKLPLWKAILFVAGGMIGLILGGQWIVEGAIEIARLFNLSESVIGLTVVAAGTSLPELATSAVAAYKRNSDIAIGNVVGSNIFNVFLILGVTSTITPVSFDPALNRDVFINILASLLMFLFLFTGKGRRIDRKEGALFVLIYLAYLSYLLYNLKS
jgi:cation:H+ antiporter